MLIVRGDSRGRGGMGQEIDSLCLILYRLRRKIMYVVLLSKLIKLKGG